MTRGGRSYWWVIGLLIAFLLVAFVKFARAADLDGAHKDSPLHKWFDQLRSSRGGLCCSLADGFSIKDVDWDTDGNHYRVRLNGEWIVVPDDALVTEPNRYGPAVVWPITSNGVTTIRCFMPGTLT